MRQKNINEPKKSFIESKIVTLLLLVFLFVLAVSFLQNISKLRLAREIIKSEKDTNDEIAEQVLELQEELGEARSDEFLEEQLRDGLGMAKRGEVVLVMPEEEYIKSLVSLSPDSSEEQARPNWQKWIEVFL